MATSKNAKIEFESGQSANDYAAMIDSGDHKIHTISGGILFSGKSGFEAIVRPNGMVSGRNVVSIHADVDKVTIAAFTAYSGGTLHSVAATTLTLTKAATDVAQIHSVTMNNSGAAVIVEGEESVDDTFSTVRGAAGGPPSIPEDSVEIAQIQLTGNASVVVSEDEIFQVVGTHAERFDYPMWNVNTLGEGDKASSVAKKNAYIEFDSALPMIHGSAAEDPADSFKKAYIRYYVPIMVEASKSLDFVPAENSHSVSSTQIYNGTVGSVAESLGQASFTALMTDNITDALLQEQDEIITIKHYPDRNKTAYTLTQGVLGVKRTFPVADQNQAACTISAENKTVGFSS